MASGIGRLLGRAIGAALPFIRLGVTLGRSIESLGNLITGAFARLEAGQVRAVIEREREIRGAEREVLGRPLSEQVPDEMIPEALTRQRRTFAWRTRFGFIDPRTGKRADRHLTVSTDERLSAEEALEEARQMLEDDYEIDPSFIVEEEVIGVTRAGPGRRL